MEISNFRPYSIGIVAADKEDDSKMIEVFPYEMFPFFEGTITDKVSPINRKVTDSTGKVFSIELDSGMSVLAEWVGETNRRTAPNVKAGEQVMIYTTCNSERYWWSPLGRDDEKRRGERIVWSWNASSEGSDTDIEINDNNHYYLTVDTISQMITLHTSKDNGEHCRYKIQINTGKGHITASDDVGNIIQLDTKNTKITFRNKDNTHLSLDKEDIIAFAPRDIHTKCNRDMLVEVGRNYTEIVGGDRTTTIQGNDTLHVDGDKSETVKGSRTEATTGNYTVTAENISMTASSNYEITTQSYSLTCTTGNVVASGTYTVTSPSIGLTGAVAILGGISAAPGSGGGGASAVINMPLTCTKPVTASDLQSPTWNNVTQDLHLIDT